MRCFSFKFINFAVRKQRSGLPLVLCGKRKVRAAQDAPLPKVEAIGDSRIWQKKTTAMLVRGKGEKVGQEPTSHEVTHGLCHLEVASSRIPSSEGCPPDSP